MENKTGKRALARIANVDGKQKTKTETEFYHFHHASVHPHLHAVADNAEIFMQFASLESCLLIKCLSSSRLPERGNLEQH